MPANAFHPTRCLQVWKTTYKTAALVNSLFFRVLHLSESEKCSFGKISIRDSFCQASAQAQLFPPNMFCRYCPGYVNQKARFQKDTTVVQKDILSVIGFLSRWDGILLNSHTPRYSHVIRKLRRQVALLAEAIAEATSGNPRLAVSGGGPIFCHIGNNSNLYCRNCR